MSNESKTQEKGAKAAAKQPLTARRVGDMILNNALIILMVIAVIYIAIINPNFLSTGSIVNIISQTAAYLPAALGIGGCIVLTGTDLSAGRIVGLTACVSASLLQSTLNMAQLIVYTLLLIYVTMGNNNGMAIANLDKSYTDFVKGEMFNIGGASVPWYVLYAVILTFVMWFIWNKTKFGKNMFALGSNEEAARVSGVNVFLTTVMVFALAGAMYGFTGFIEGARIASNTANTGFNYELDAIAACVIGGVSFVGGIGKISGIVIGVLMLRLIFIGLNMIPGMNQNFFYLIKGAIILFACALDMRKYLAKK